MRITVVMYYISHGFKYWRSFAETCSSRQRTVLTVGTMFQFHPFSQRILQLSDQYNLINALAFIYSSHSPHVSAIKYSGNQAILQQY